MTAREKLELVAMVSCSMTVLLIMLCLLPGWIEIREKLGKVTKRTRRRHRAGHRVQAHSQGSPDHGDPGEDTQRIEAAA